MRYFLMSLMITIAAGLACTHKATQNENTSREPAQDREMQEEFKFLKIQTKRRGETLHFDSSQLKVLPLQSWPQNEVVACGYVSHSEDHLSENEAGGKNDSNEDFYLMNVDCSTVPQGQGKTIARFDRRSLSSGHKGFMTSAKREARDKAARENQTLEKKKERDLSKYAVSRFARPYICFTGKAQDALCKGASTATVIAPRKMTLNRQNISKSSWLAE